MAFRTSHQMDSKWSWVILALTFSCVFLFSLLGTSVGMAQVEMIEDLKFGSGVVSIMTSFAVGLSTLLGPLSGVIASVLTMRRTIIIGTIVMSVGMLLTAFSHSLPALLFCYGIMTGLGHGIAFSPCMIIIHHYFKKRLLLANGIMTSASSFAMFSLPYLHRYILDEYGWRYCFALNGALILHIIVFASFFEPTPLEKASLLNLSDCLSRQGDASKNGSECDNDNEINIIDLTLEVNNDNPSNNRKENENVSNTDMKINNKDNVAQENNLDDVYLSSAEDIKQLEEKLFLSKESIVSKKMDMLIRSTDSVSLASRALSCNGMPVKGGVNGETGGGGGGSSYIPIYINGTPKLNSPVSHFIATHSPSVRRSVHSDDQDMNKFIRDRSASQMSGLSALTFDDHSSIPSTQEVGKLNGNSVHCIANTAMRSKSLHPNKHFGQLRKGESMRSHLGSSVLFASSDMGSCVMLPFNIEEVNNDEKDESEQLDMSMAAKIKRIASCKLFLLFCLNSLFFMSGCGTHSIHLPSYVESKGVPAYLMASIYSVYGIVIAVGRLIGAVVYNKLQMPLIPLLFFLQALNGVCLLFAPLYASNAAGIFAMEVGIGLTYGQSYMIQGPIVTQLVGVQDLTLAFGFLQLFNGMGYIGCPILAGFVYDATGTLDIPMQIAGSMVSFGSFIVMLMLIYQRRAKKQTEKQITLMSEDQDKSKTECLLKENENKV